MLYIPLFLLLFAVLSVELKHASTSRGIVSATLGCLTFSFGLVNTPQYDKPFTWLAIAIGLFIALLGTARFIVTELNRHH